MNKEKNEICPICNDEVEDESYADGVWDLTFEIFDELDLTEKMVNTEYQDNLYARLQGWIKRMGYCPNCGRELKENEQEKYEKTH